MTSKRMWRVAAGRGALYAREFVDGGFVAVGFKEAGDAIAAKSQIEMIELFRHAYPGQTERQISVRANQLWRFIKTISVGDEVLTYAPIERTYHLGEVTSAASFHPSQDAELQTRRSVKWNASVSRDSLSQATRNTLGAIQTLILVSEAAGNEIRALASGSPPVVAGPTALAPIEDAADPFAGIEEQALERVKDRIGALDWEQMQDFVAAVLRSMGYRTSVSARGSDRGRDIVASPDGFGLAAPRIVVEVKHRPSQSIGAPDIRSFLGGRHKDDRGLFVSTGGFTQEARYEAERAAIPLTLMTLDDLARAAIDRYESFDERGRLLLPLVRLYWPL